MPKTPRRTRNLRPLFSLFLFRIRRGWRDTPGCFGRRNCNVNLDDLRWDRPDLDCEPQQARGIPRNLQLDETVSSCPVRVKAALSG